MSVLERIFEQKHAEVAEAIKRISLSEVRAEAEAAEPCRGFRTALKQGAITAKGGLALIAEVKKASPSKGLIRPNFDPATIALAYQTAGVHALSVLTDAPNFQGSSENLRIAKLTVTLPCLRKDFLDDPYQVYEARAWGADAILLIVASLSKSQLHDLRALATELGMDSLVEVHTEAEAEIALAEGADLIGVNNRNLADFTVDVANSERIIPLIASHCLAVSESALRTRRDLDRVRDAGASAVLIGTTFCASPDIEAKVREVMAW